MRRLDRAALVGACRVSIAVLLLMTGCGTAEGAGRSVEGPASVEGASVPSGGVETAVADAPPAHGSKTEPVASLDGESWEPASPEINAAFAQVRANLGERVVFAPTLLPPGMRLAADAAGDGGARAAVTAEAPGGRIQFLQVIEGDVGDLPYEIKELADGRRVAIYQVMGGFLLQWEYEGAWYGLQGTGYSDSELMRVAQAMRAL